MIHVGRTMNLALSLFCATVLYLCPFHSAAAATSHVTHPETGVQTWELHDQGVGFVMMQITPDQARGFFLARGFDRAAVDYFASHCVFMTIVRNESVPESISYQLSDWIVYPQQGKPSRLKITEDWQAEWKQRKIADPSLIAFQWALYPSKQTFEMGDWNQGMTTYALPLGSLFNLKFKWNVKGATHEATLENIQCASNASDR